jgi:hypothetical protein
MKGYSLSLQIYFCILREIPFSMTFMEERYRSASTGPTLKKLPIFFSFTWRLSWATFIDDKGMTDYAVASKRFCEGS